MPSPFAPFLALLAAARCLGGSGRCRGRASLSGEAVRIVVGYAAGGVGDITARLIAQKLSTALGQQVIVDNRPSAGGIIAAEIVAKAEPDGYTLLHLNYGNAVSVALFKSLPYDIERDFAPISPMGFFDVLVLVNKTSPLGGVRDLVSAANAMPEKFKSARSASAAASTWPPSSSRRRRAPNLTIVPFKTTPALITALMGNEIQAAFEIGAPVMSLVKSGDLKALAVSSRKAISRAAGRSDGAGERHRRTTTSRPGTASPRPRRRRARSSSG